MTFIKLLLPLLLIISLAQAKERNKVDINFKNLKIADFLKMSAKILNKNILINQKISGNVDFVSTTPIYEDEILDLILAIIESKGFTLVRDGNFLKTVKTSVASRENLPVVSSTPNGSLMVTQAIHIDTENIDIIVQKIRHLISHSAKLVTLKESNTMVLTDYPDNIRTIKKVVKAMVSEANMKLEFITLENAKASTVHTSVTAIAKDLVNQRIASNKITILKDDSSNSLMIIAQQKHIDKLRPTIIALDTEENFDAQKIEVLQLKNAEAVSLSKTIQTIVSKKQPVKKGKVTKVPAGAPTISADEELNALIIIGTNEQIKDINALVVSLDVPRQQVYVKAKIIEISEQESRNIGLTYGINAGVAGSNGLYQLGVQLTGSAPDLATLAAAGVTGGSGFTMGLALAFLEQNSAAKVLSEPSILCVNNKISNIYVGDTTSVATGSSNGVAGTVSTFKRLDVGLTLEVKPRLSGDNKVSMEVTVQLEGLNGIDANGQPNTTKRTVKTSAIVNDSEPVIVGGLIKNSNTGSRGQIPYLADIPFIGGLFRSDTVLENRTNLVVVLTPYIVNSSSDMNNLRKRLSDLNTMQDTYNSSILNAIKANERVALHTENNETEDEF
jgi:general secretion pathway protein D